MTSPAETDMAFADIVSFLEDELAFEASFYDDGYLRRRLKARLRRTGPDAYSDYLDLLRRDEDEQVALLDTLSVNVTGFFRNPDVWRSLRDVLVNLTASRDKVHCWSAACADGREPYSMALLSAADNAIDETAISVLATDIDRGALARAERGVYDTTRTVDIEAQLREVVEFDGLVEREDDRFTIADAIKSRVTFERHDLVRDPPYENMDLVCCRNLLIYIARDYKLTIFETLISSLAPNGYLVIGMSETIPRELADRLEPVDRSKRIYRRV